MRGNLLGTGTPSRLKVLHDSWISLDGLVGEMRYMLQPLLRIHSATANLGLLIRLPDSRTVSSLAIASLDCCGFGIKLNTVALADLLIAGATLSQVIHMASAVSANGAGSCNLRRI